MPLGTEAPGDPASPGADPRAWRTADADGKPITVFIGDGSVWLDVNGELARLGGTEAMSLGGRIGGAARRIFGPGSVRPRNVSAAPPPAPVGQGGPE